MDSLCKDLYIKIFYYLSVDCLIVWLLDLSLMLSPDIEYFVKLIDQFDQKIYCQDE